MNNTKIIWHHYGDGEIFDEIKKIADEKLTGKVQYEFMGAVDNKELLEIYKNGNYHFFLNTSSSEGIPVSIMEASSFGIPCLATDVGGTREIIKNGENGILLDSDIKDEELAREIQRFISLDKESYLEYREKARIIWQENFDATRNYKEFSEMLEKLI